MNSPKRIRLLTLVCLLLIIPLGLASKFYRGWGETWVNNSLSGIFYVIFWCFVIFLIKPGFKPRNIAAGVFLVTAALEFLQLWQPPFLQGIRSTFIGVTILGNTFILSDFLYYLIGSILGWLLIRRIQQRGKKIQK